jgi:hypothetical protein
MAKSSWSDLAVGDFFAVPYDDKPEDFYIYQKIDNRAHPFNAVIINSGRLCVIAESGLPTFERVSVAFEIQKT